MRVLVDYQIFLSQRYGGISNYHSIIHNTINEMQTGSVSTILALGSDNNYIKGQGAVLKPLNVRGRGKSILRSINQYALGLSLSKFDVFHPTYYDNYFLKSHKVPPFVITIHDVIPEKFFTDERSLAMMRNKKDLVSRATRIIAISETTKKQLLNFYDVAPDTIAVIPHGSPENFRPLLNDPDMPSVRRDERPYILYVGFRWQYKNFLFFLESVAELLTRHDIRMTIAGPPPTEEELKAISQLNIRERVAFVVHPSQAELYQLYNQAFCFAFPSLDEGFGLPLLEAATADCPVVCSDIDIFHEISGDSALYFDPRSADHIQMQLEKLISDSSLRDGLIRRGTENLDHFSWQEAASKTLEVYHSASKTA